MSISISVELIPRSEEQLIHEAEYLTQFTEITHINIPDLQRFPIRSWEATKLLREEYADRFGYVSHISVVRSGFGWNFNEHDIQLVISGDPPQDFSKRCLAGATSFLEQYKGSRVSTMAAIDQYRSSLVEELEYIDSKVNSGAKGFFTQPYFSVAHAKYWSELLPFPTHLSSEYHHIFFGVTPITTEGALSYWKNKNKAVFPSDFSLSMGWQIKFAKNMINWARSARRHIYLMPIRVPLEEYIGPIFAK